VIHIQIVGTLVVCQKGLKDSWREAANFIKNGLEARFEGKVNIQYFDLFDKDCPAIPADAKIPVVLIQDKVFSNGEKLSMPRMRTYLETILTPMNKE